MNKIKLYICGVDFQHELGCACGGNKLYPSVEDLKENASCWKTCGIIELEVDMDNYKWIVEQDLFNPEGSVTSAEMKTLAYKKRQLNHWQEYIEQQQERLKYFDEMVQKLEKEIEEHE